MNQTIFCVISAYALHSAPRALFVQYE